MPDNNDYTMLHSKLSGELVQGNIAIQVNIFRGDAERFWMLEVVDAEGTSTVWSERFETDQAAMDELRRTIEAEGIQIFAPDQGTTKR